MLIDEPVVAGADALVAVKAYLRIDGTGEDAVLAALVETAIASCEGYTGTTLIARGFVETIEAPRAFGSWWRALSASPVVAITGVTDGAGVPVPAAAYELDIDASGTGRLRLFGVGSRVTRVTYRAGLASGWATIPEPLRHGIVRMVAHLHALRDQADALGPPATALALWQGARRMRLS